MLPTHISPGGILPKAIGLALCAAALALPAAAHESKKVEAPPLQVEQTEDGEPALVHEGEASFYGKGFHGKKTATGERFDQNKATAASRELPLGTKATVTNQENGKSIDVMINDRGPYVDGRVIDLSQGAAKKLDMIEDGVAPVRVEAVPSEQPTEKAKEKIESKAEETAAENQTAENPQPGTRQ
ncbi:septal ring lytic transglycosylase RlpA family protein [Azospirillum sp. SYSU D00513]|uniref:septal ring lytic transglycosylase RlpA family protein n=1 Tax=Azospirillum sp. SYSU D00513 TaxID=2812561 RepID=UPI001A95ED2E|nr:septal ring lytic transglycosylase RlpA family protein [Azospirillum sp. SYSU D00513]